MSTDRAVLAALASHTKKELSYFELIALRLDGRRDHIFLCIGKHALYLVNRDLSGMYQGDKGGEIYYAYIDRVVEDEQSETDLLITMNENRPSQWSSEQLFVMSESRIRLVHHLTVAWQTDHAWRKGRILTLPRSVQPLRKKALSGLHLSPFQKFQKVFHEGYSIFLPETYRMKSTRSGSDRTFIDEAREVEVGLSIEEPIPLADVEAGGHDSIRWVGMDFKQAMTQGLSEVVLIRNALYLKKMNLANDIACWVGWEVFLKSASCAVAAVLLRRQYIPPMLDALQDISVVVSCPIHTLVEGIVGEEELLHEARLIADSVSPRVLDCTQHQTLYRDLVQAKIDALLFHDDAMSWLNNVFSLERGDHVDQGTSVSLRRPSAEMDAWAFLGSIMNVLLEENALSNPELLGEIPPHAVVLSKPINVRELVLDRAEHLLGGGRADPASREGDPAMNAWLARNARFFAHCVDGFLLGRRFTLCDVAGAALGVEKTRQKIDAAILFMLHARPKDMTQPFGVTSIKNLLHDPTFFHDYTFNDRVMQSLLELGWIRRCLSETDIEDDHSDKLMSSDYALFLSHLLTASTSSANLKASVCRQLIANSTAQSRFRLILPAVFDVIRQPNLYLKTYATVTLVNLSRGQDAVKNAIMEDKLAGLVIENLKSQDDDLIHYSLVLLTNLTKHVKHRTVIFQQKSDFPDILTDLLRNSVSADSKSPILSEVAGIIGQLCTEYLGWNAFCSDSALVTHILMDVNEEAELGGKVKSKVMFALKQICSSPKLPPTLSKDAIGSVVIPKVVAEIKHALEQVEALEASDGASSELVDPSVMNNAVHLLYTLSVTRRNCDHMAREGLIEALEGTMVSPLCQSEGSKESSNAVCLLHQSTIEQISKLWSTLHGKYMAEGVPQMPAASRTLRKEAGGLAA